MLLSFILLIFGFVLLVRGADYFVDGASALASRLHIPAIIIGLTVVAMGTSAPEAAISITSALNGSNAIAVGNIVGSNIINIFLILGLTALIAPLGVQKNTAYFEMPFVIFMTALLYFFGMHYGYITHVGAWVLLGLFMCFLVYLFFIARQSQSEIKEIKKYGLTRMVLYIVLGLLALVLGSDFTVKSAVEIATFLGVSQRVIGLTIIAIGTSLPELVTSVMAARKGETDIAIGNIVGSNIFNILFVLGISGAILPIPFETAFLFDTKIAMLAAVLLLLCSCRTMQLGRKSGILFLVLYVLYLIYLI